MGGNGGGEDNRENDKGGNQGKGGESREKQG